MLWDMPCGWCDVTRKALGLCDLPPNHNPVQSRGKLSCIPTDTDPTGRLTGRPQPGPITGDEGELRHCRPQEEPAETGQLV